MVQKNPNPAILLIGIPILIALTWLTTLIWRSQQLETNIAQGTIAANNPPALPLMEGPWRIAARTLLAQRPSNFDIIEQQLQKSLKLRPLYAPTWLNLAELERRRGQTETAARYAEQTRRLWPAHPKLLWRVANFEIKLGRYDTALEVLRDLWRVSPYESARILSLAYRLEDDPERLNHAIIPDSAKPTLDPAFYHQQFLHHAQRIKDTGMATVGWSNAPSSITRNPKYALPYINSMMWQKQPGLALDAWHQLTGKTAGPGNVHNPGFETEHLNGGFGWKFSDIKGAISSIVTEIEHPGNHTLRVEFDGSANLNYHHVRQIVPVAPGMRYRLDGRWRGENITTRSGIFVDFRTLDAEKNAYVRSSHQFKSWDWQPFTLELKMPSNAQLAEIRIRRRPTDALDQKVAGRVWFDDFTLTPLPEK